MPLLNRKLKKKINQGNNQTDKLPFNENWRGEFKHQPIARLGQQTPKKGLAHISPSQSVLFVVFDSRRDFSFRITMGEEQRHFPKLFVLQNIINRLQKGDRLRLE